MPLSSITQRFVFSVAGQPLSLANQFALPVLDLEEQAALYDVSVGADSTSTLWDGAPLPTTFDVLALVSEQSCDIEFTVNSGASLFTLFLRGGGYPLVLQGDDSYVEGDTGGTLGTITMIRAKNRNTLDATIVTVLLGKQATA